MSFQPVVDSGLTGETGVTELQTSLEASPNKHPQDCPTDAAGSRAVGEDDAVRAHRHRPPHEPVGVWPRTAGKWLTR
ncbi:MAG: hypothetical protein V6Z86_09900, partial [Hyphomicrobiales bacterium]